MQVFGRMLKLKSTGLKKSSCNSIANIKHEGYQAKILKLQLFLERKEKKLCFKHRKLLYLDLPMYPLKDTRFFCPRLLHVSMSRATFLVNDVLCLHGYEIIKTALQTALQHLIV